MDDKTSHTSCDKDISQTNLLLAQILLKTTSESTKLTDNCQLLSVIRSLCNSSELYFSRPTPLQLKNDVIIKSRAINGSTCTYDSSLSTPSSVHVADVTHDICFAYEHPASHGVSATANETNAMDDINSQENSEGLSSVSMTQSDSRKRPGYSSSDSILGLPSKRTFQGNTNDIAATISEEAITCLSDLTRYVEESKVKTKVMKNAYSKIIKDGKEGMYVICIVLYNLILLFNLMRCWNTYSDLYEYMHNLIELCNHDRLTYQHHSIVILEDLPKNATKSGSTCIENYFSTMKVQRLIAVERPSQRAQIYVAYGLRNKYHFTCPTMFLPELLESIQRVHNPQVELLFVPRMVHSFHLQDCLHVLNDIDFVEQSFNNHCKEIFDAVTGTGSHSSSTALGTSTKRSQFSLSIGLQTMYSHQQHLARFCMLPHSKPHVPTVKNHPKFLKDTMILVYKYVTERLFDHSMNDSGNPFEMMNGDWSDNNMKHRQMLRADLRNYLCTENCDGIDDRNIFEACTVQPTSSLGFHKDTMNSPDMDKTIACFIPCIKGEEIASECLSFLYYSRKCVDEHVQRMSQIEIFLSGEENSDLSKLALKSMLHQGCVFDYQGSLFEATPSLNVIAKDLEHRKEFSCKEVIDYTSLDCFKHGAAFDKMGYYSIFVNVFLSLHYFGLVTNIDDAISLCIYFGFLCNGTSSLAGTWKQLHLNKKGALKFYKKNKYRTVLFEIMLRTNRSLLQSQQHGDDKSPLLFGNCKLPRFQYANYGDDIICNVKQIHATIKDFIAFRMQNGMKMTADKQHQYLQGKLKKNKGIGPMSYNQFWHSLCLCGVLPHGYLDCSAIAPASGPAKLIQIFHPSTKSPIKLLEKLNGVRNDMSKLGLSKINNFFLENMFCEIYRITGSNGRKLFTKEMSCADKKDIITSPRFQSYISNSATTRHPDIYFKSPFTNQWQHLFRVADGTIYMCPSFLENNVGQSVQLQCTVLYDENGSCQVDITGDYIRRSGISPCDLFVSTRNGK